jgi:acyl-CoA thioester hydrolase
VSFSFTIELKVRFAETDAQGIAHHAAYFVWLETARVEYLGHAAGGYQKLRDEGVEATTLEAYLRYLTPARFDDVLAVRTRCGDLRGARFRFDYLIERGEEAIAEGWTTHACVDARTFRPTRLPDGLRQAIERTEA